jgi:Fe-S oxidoreductase
MGSVMTAKSLIFMAVFAGAIGLSIYNIRRLISYLKLGKFENRWTNIPARIKQTLIVAIAQKKILRDKVAGPLHAGIFWGFLILLTSAIDGILEGVNEAWSLNFLGPAYSAFTILTDIFCSLIVMATMIAIWRRYITKIKRLQVEAEKIEAGLILLTIFTIVSSILLQNASRIALGEDFSWAVRPISTAIATMIPVSSAHTLFEVFWWMHMVLILSFLNYLPYSKHLHVLTSVLNVFFGLIPEETENSEVRNSLKRIDFEDESIEKYGATDIEDFSWKTMLDGYTCTHCGRCTSVCPANQTGKVLDPREIIVQIHHRTMDKGPLAVKLQKELDKHISQDDREAIQTLLDGASIEEVGKETIDKYLYEEEQEVWDKKLIGDYVDPEALWACTTCGACMQECPVNIEHVPPIVDMRRSLVMMEAEFPQEVQPAYNNMETNSSPWAFSAEDRTDWTEGTNVKTAAENPDFEVLFWVGCAGSFDDRAKKITKAFAELMELAGVNFAILGSEESCTGDPARRSGNEYLADMLTQMNVETLNGYGVNLKKIVTTCPHCLNTLMNDYPQFGGKYTVLHHTQFIKELTDGGKLKVKEQGASQAAIAYHDSCYLGRYNKEYEAPRAAITNVPGLEIIDVKRSKDKGFCCGAGGGRMFMEETVGKMVNAERTEELLNTGAETIAVNCPFCMTMMTDGVKAHDKNEEVEVKDVSEILLENIKR